MSKNALKLWIGTAVLLAGTLVLGRLSTRRIPEPLAHPLDQIDSEIVGWKAAGDSKLDSHTLKSLDPTSYLVRSYRRGDSQLELFIAFYALQRAGESMHSPRRCLPGGGWEIIQRAVVPLPGFASPPMVNKFSIENSGRKVLMFYWYQSHDRVVADEYAGKILLARDTILTGHTAGSIVRINLTDGPGAEQDALQFAAKVLPQVQRCLGFAPSSSQISALR